MTLETSDPRPDTEPTRNGAMPVARLAGAVEVALLAAAAAGLQDVEAGLLAMAGTVLLLLTRWRAGRLGLLGLAILSVDVAVWMGPGAFSNLTHDEGFIETALPSLLSLAALVTLVAVAGVFLPRGRTSRAPVVVASLSLVVAAVVLVFAALGAGGGTAAEPDDLQVVTKNVRFSDESLEVAAGRVGIFVANEDLFWHTFTIPELDVDVNVPVGAERRATFTAGPGTYRFVCTIPGHTQAGMEGTLTVR